MAWLASAFAVRGGELNVVVENPPTTGLVSAWLYDSADAFADLRDPIRKLSVPAGREQELRFVDLPPGRYAVLVFHDRNANEALDVNFMGIPREPLGFSNRYWGRGAPAFSEAAVEVTSGGVLPVPVELRDIFPRRGLVGVGLGVVAQSSVYRDADRLRIQPIPAVSYIGPRIQILGPLAQVGVVHWPRMRLAATARYRLGAYREKDSLFLEGMGDRKDSLFGGVALQGTLPWGLRLSAGYEHDVLDRVGGGFGRVAVRRGFQVGRYSLGPSLGLNWLTAELAGHEYGVTREERREEHREEYRPGSAINPELGFGVSAEWFGALRVILSGSAEVLSSSLRDSPLVDESAVYRVFAAVNTTF